MRNPYVLTLSISISATLLLAAGTAVQDGVRFHSPKNPAAESDSAERAEKNAKKHGKKKRNRKQAVQPADYAQWERLDSSNRKLSRNGAWLVYSVSRVDDERSLHLHRLKGKKMPEVATFQQGERPVFSNDGAWLAVTIGKTPAEIRKARKEGSKAPPSAGSTIHLRRLSDGETTEFKNVRTLQFSDDSRHAAIEVVAKASAPPRPGTSAPPSKGPASALIIRDLSSGTDTTFGNVQKFAWSDTGALLAMVIDSPSISNSLQVFAPESGVLRTLDSGVQEYASLHWREDALDLAVMREMEHADKEDVSHVLLAWRNLDQAKPGASSYKHIGEAKFPENMYIASGGLTWSEDGQAVYCDLKKWEKKPKALEPEKEEPKKKEEAKPAAKDQKENPAEKKAEAQPADRKAEEKPAAKEADTKETTPAPKGKQQEAARKPAPKEQPRKTLRETIEADSNVEVWHSKDVEIMPLQKKQAAAKKNPKRRAVWWPEKGTLVQLATELTESVDITRTGRKAIGSDRTPHERTAMFGPRLQDIYVIDTSSGKRERVLESIKHTLSTSPDGRFLLYVREGHIWSLELRTGEQRNLTGELGTHFTDLEDDTLAVEKRPYGRGSWLKDGSAVVLYDRFDMWLVAPDGSMATRLTDGGQDMIRHRMSQASFHPDDDGLIDPGKPLYVALYGERTKKSGYGRLSLGPKPGKIEILLWEDKAIMFLTKARDAEVFMLTKEGADDSPDLFVGGPDFAKLRQVTRTNKFQQDYHWGRAELVDFENEHGVQLQGSLLYPAGYKPGKKYPMIVYIYEKRSQNLHRYNVPSEKHPYNPAVFSSEGYFVFQPDIVYRPQEPGISALECVVPAVRKVLDTGMVDEKRIGLVGHSWGAYQTAFIVTRSDLFAAGVAGAPLTDMMSMSVSVYWNSGRPNASIFAQSQGRMGKPFWRDVDTYVRNSPIHGLDTLNTPLLIAFGDKDGAVDWGQGVQMYNAARWAGIEDLVMLVYPGENHGLRKEENMVDYHYRVREWFDHHVKGLTAPKWITEGTSFLEREKQKEEKKESKAKKPAPAKPAPTKPAPARKEAAKPQPTADQNTAPGKPAEKPRKKRKGKRRK